MDYKTMNIEDIIKWCQANSEISWLKDIAEKRIYAIDENGSYASSKRQKAFNV